MVRCGEHVFVHCSSFKFVVLSFCFSRKLCLCGVLPVLGVRVFVCSGLVVNVFFCFFDECVLVFFMGVVFVQCVVWCACVCV